MLIPTGDEPHGDVAIGQRNAEGRGTKLYDPNRLAVVLDHIAPAKTEKNATDQQVSRNFARTNGINKFYDVDAGIAHLVLMEAGHVARAT
jgi:3-isopropylmalate/(R)-2-methylmalate dehydratase large subunit